MLAIAVKAFREVVLKREATFETQSEEALAELQINDIRPLPICEELKILELSATNEQIDQELLSKFLNLRIQAEENCKLDDQAMLLMIVNSVDHLKF